ncbi:hypothetical protein ACUODF_27255, partial [Escherichia coli]
FVEMGTANMPPHPFVRPAFDARQIRPDHRERQQRHR